MGTVMLILSIITSIPKIIEIVRLIIELTRGLPVGERREERRRLLKAVRECKRGGGAACEVLEEQKSRIEARLGRK